MIGARSGSQNGNRIGRLDTRTRMVSEFQAAGKPYGIAMDKAGSVWFCEIGRSMLGRLDPKTGKITELPLPANTAPRRMAAAPDGMLWVTLAGSGELIRVDP